jgi:cytochrome c oxidase assembly protein subunit 15
MRPSFRTLAAGTAAATFALILVGVYTGATGAGLACNAQWPGTDGPLGLLPATMPCFIEWGHRFLAMLIGFGIFGTALAAWRGGHGKRIRYATALALGVLPVQVLLGRNTILNFGPVSQVLHHGAALTIFTSLVVAATLAYVGDETTEATPAEADADATTGARADD